TKVCSRRCACGKNRHIESDDSVQVPHSTIGDQTGDAAALKSSGQNVTNRRGSPLASGIDDEHGTRSNRLNGQPLRVAGVVENIENVQVLPGRDISKGECFPNQASAAGIKPSWPLKVTVAEPQ